MDKQIDYTDINPVDMKDEICKLLTDINVEYEIHDNNSDKGYGYLKDGDVCVTVINPTGNEPLYIDLTYMEEFTLTYGEWHTHYEPEKWSYDKITDHIKSILNNTKCTINVYSEKEWIGSFLSQGEIGEDYDYKTDTKGLPKRVIKEAERSKGRIELVYWDTSKNLIINL